MKVEFSQQVFDKYQNIKVHENPSNKRRVVPYGQKDGHHKLNSRFSQFCERAYFFIHLLSNAILCPQYKKKEKIEQTTETTNERNKI
jgi:hypothetical protein